MTFEIPALNKNHENKERKAGFEIEFTGIDLKDAAHVVKNIFNGNVFEKSKFEYIVSDTLFGDFSIELDADILLNKGYEHYLSKAGINLSDYSVKPEIEELLNKLASTVVPYEVVTPPIPFSDLYLVDNLSDELRLFGAKGTKSSFLNAFGMHINAEVPSFEADVLVFYLKSFFLLYDYIIEKSQIDFSRKMTPFIDKFEDEYIKLVLNENYLPSINELIDDYIKFNPTRNRALDMLPVFAFIDESRVKNNVKDYHLTGKRPSFHYRLPNSCVGSKDWKPSQEWNLWVKIENLASDKDKINELSKDFFNNQKNFFHKTKWISKIKKFYNEK
jgi:hypothetical protein